MSDATDHVEVRGKWLVVGLAIPPSGHGARVVTLRPLDTLLCGCEGERRLSVAVTWTNELRDSAFEIKLGDECEMSLVIRRFAPEMDLNR